MSRMTLKTEGDTHVVVTRRFAASPEAVYRAHTDPELIQQWLLGPEGWFMPVCVSEAAPGGRIRYEWTNGKGRGFYLTGEYLELTPYSRIVHVERMHLPDPTPDNHVETMFERSQGAVDIGQRQCRETPKAIRSLLDELSRYLIHAPREITGGSIVAHVHARCADGSDCDIDPGIIHVGECRLLRPRSR